VSIIHMNLVALGHANNHVQGGWAHPEDHQGEGLMTTEYWSDLARTLERGRFDGIFFADTLSAGVGTPEAMAEGGGSPGMDPFALLMAMGMATTHLGLATTLTTVGTPPYLAVRRIGTLDNLTGGRVAWNVVTSYAETDFECVGLTRPEHDTRYDEADEYMEVAYRLWDGFPRDAIVMDKELGRYVDPAKISRVDFDGEYFHCHTLPTVVQSPQGRPLIFQAGASPRGMRFAATHADAVFALQPRVAMETYVKGINAAAAEVGRPDPRIFFGVQPYVASTEAEAQKRVEELRTFVSLGPALNMLGGLLGRKFTEEELDKPIELRDSQGSQGWVTAIENFTRDHSPTVREMALDLNVSPMTPRIVGTPEHVADVLEEWWRASGAYGFTFSPNIMPDGIERFVDHVVPILQERGLWRREYAGTTYRENLSQQDQK
jgi:long-chain alkane monooxygenase